MGSSSDVCKHGLQTEWCGMCSTPVSTKLYETEVAINEAATTCRSCGAAIFFAQTARNAKTIPLDLDRVEGGRFRIKASGRRFIAYYIDEFEMGLFRQRNDGRDDYAYQPHFVSCPNADQHRRR